MIHTCVDSLPMRIDALYLYSLVHRSRVGRFSERVYRFNQLLEEEYSREHVLWRIYAWHRLIGSTPPEEVLPLDQEVQSAALERIHQFLSQVESEWCMQ